MKRTLTFLLPLLIAGAAFAGEDHKHDGHDHAPGEKPALKLNGKSKWGTDAPLRAGMTQLKDKVQAAHPAIHARKYTEAEYRALAAELDTALAGIFKDCKLPPDADAMLHIVLVDVMAGSAQMKGDGGLEDMRKGAVKVIMALRQYGEFFDHPGWAGVR